MEMEMKRRWLNVVRLITFEVYKSTIVIFYDVLETMEGPKLISDASPETEPIIKKNL